MGDSARDYERKSWILEFLGKFWSTSLENTWLGDWGMDGGGSLANHHLDRARAEEVLCMGLYLGIRYPHVIEAGFCILLLLFTRLPSIFVQGWF